MPAKRRAARRTARPSTRTARSASISPKNLKLGLVILGIILLLVAMPLGIILLLGVAGYHFLGTKNR